MNLTRIFLVALVGLCFAATGRAQQAACTLTVEQAPELRGFRLGMPLSAVRTRLPGLAVSAGELGLSQTWLSQDDLKKFDAATYQGVRAIAFTFLDERLTSIGVDYNYPIRWDNGDQFAAKVAETLKLPPAWQKSGDDNPFGRYFKCDGFVVSTYPNSISLRDDGASQTLQQRRREQEEKLRQSFRP